MERSQYKETLHPYSFAECRGIAIGTSSMTLATHPWVCAREVGTTVVVRNYNTEGNMNRWTAGDFQKEVVIDQTNGTWAITP